MLHNYLSGVARCAVLFVRETATWTVVFRGTTQILRFCVWQASRRVQGCCVSVPAGKPSPWTKHKVCKINCGETYSLAGPIETPTVSNVVCGWVWRSGPTQPNLSRSATQVGVGDPISRFWSGPRIGYRPKLSLSVYLTLCVSGKRSDNLNFCLKTEILHNMTLSRSYFMKTIRSDYPNFSLLFS